MTTTARKTTGRLFFNPFGESGYVDFGNCLDHKLEPEYARAPHSRFDRGRKVVDLELLKMTKQKRSFTFDERIADTLKLLALGSQAADLVQAAAVGQTAVIVLPDLRVGRTYSFGKLSVSNVAGQNDDDYLVAGTDYKIDAGAGLLTILRGTLLVSPWYFSFDCAAVTQLNFTALAALLARGTFRFQESDATDAVPLNIDTFFGQCQVTSWGENNAEDFNRYTLEVIHDP